MMMFGLDFVSAVGASVTSIGNIGPGLGEVGPVNTFEALPDGAKITSMLLMIFGRLELFTILVLFMPYFWKTN